MGEDLHMALKCYLRTNMQASLHPVYIPASCSSVQAKTNLATVGERFKQAKRHLWGMLDFGYAQTQLLVRKAWFRKTVFSLMNVTFV